MHRTHRSWTAHFYEIEAFDINSINTMIRTILMCSHGYNGDYWRSKCEAWVYGRSRACALGHLCSCTIWSLSYQCKKRNIFITCGFKNCMSPVEIPAIHIRTIRTVSNISFSFMPNNKLICPKLGKKPVRETHESIIGLNTMHKKLTMEHDVIVNHAQTELLEYCGELS